MDTKRVTNSEAATVKTRQVNNNDETIKQRQQAAERMRLYRARKRQQQFHITVYNHNPQPNATYHTQQSALRTSIILSLRHSFIQQSVLRQVQSLFQSELST
jgi:hypothetical protein